ncbi:amidase [Mycolicibacterium sp. 018/SC-01/001]|uniref:amidase family protein n=1 Tax=Mycolicibacterium sp. 018/SC-01/001 TaxID=2592069 RepID=UPI00117BFA14|nr:amidase family protein [Mycolicibacterium sp. 018/SC-01/001]TRW78581.1 amidase [Mycolicibacterium sp. 018/SC-01/001]
MTRTRTDVAALAATWGLSESKGIDDIIKMVNVQLDAAEPMAAMPSPVHPPTHWRRSTPLDDPLNAVVRWCDLPPTGDGPLSGRTISVKDSISVAGVPATCGYTGLEDFVPVAHATVVDRILRAGGRVVATTNMDCFGFAASGETSSYGPTVNPNSAAHLAGGSSSGAAAALSYPGIDMAVGCDQGGSIRIPAAWCGALGLKPTHGWVPYTGIAGIDQIIDHAGPIARSVADIATLMDVLVGRDDEDPRQPAQIPPPMFTRRVENARKSLAGLTIGVVDEAVDLTRQHGSTEILDVFEQTLTQLQALGARIERVSIPEHLTIAEAAFVCNIEGMASLLRSGGQGYGHLGRYDPLFSARLHSALQNRALELSPQVKLAWLAGTTMSTTYGGALYARARNQLASQTATYELVFRSLDMLVMPTTPIAPLLAGDHANVEQVLERGWTMLGNTSPFNSTGMPALSMPVGRANGLPVGVMLAGPKGTDAELLEVARLYEAEVGWKLGLERHVTTRDWSTGQCNSD